MVISTKKETRPSGKEKQYGCTPRVEKARDRVLHCKPSIDLERAKIVTDSFMETEGDPVAMRHAKAFREQCRRKNIFIQEDELIIGSPGSVIRAGNLAPDTKWQLVGEELDTISTRPQDPFQITEEQKKLMREFIIPYWQGKSLYDCWLARRPEDIRQLYEGTGLLFPDVQVESVATRGVRVEHGQQAVGAGRREVSRGITRDHQGSLWSGTGGTRFCP